MPVTLSIDQENHQFFLNIFIVNYFLTHKKPKKNQTILIFKT